MTNPFVFIVGCPRSGTTLLRRMVDAHPLIAVIPEIGWLAQRYDQRLGVSADGFAEPSLVEDLLRRNSLGRYTRLPVARQELEPLLDGTERMRYPDLVSLLFDRYGDARGKPLVGNKTVDHALSVRTLHVLFPSARFVHLVRDGRDVAMSAVSWRRAAKLAERFSTWAPDPVTTATLWWEWHVRMARQEGLPLGSELYLELRYEALVQDPATELARLCAFLGVVYDHVMVRFHEARQAAGESADAKHGWLPATPGLRDWRRQLARDDVERAEAAVGDLIDELGYARAVPFPSPEALGHARDVRDRFEGRPLPRQWSARRVAKDRG